MVLGTPHLDGMEKVMQREMLSPLLDRLATWRPDGIAVEAVSGLQCDSLRRYMVRYSVSVEYYCPDPAAASRATGLDVPAANAEAEKVLAAWPGNPTAAQRRHLAALFMAAGERPSAVVQWLRLPADERHEGDGLDATLVASLNKRIDSFNEIYSIAAPLAARLGHERLWNVDDHSADTSPDPANEAAFDDAIRKAWDNPDSKARKAAEEQLRQGMAQPGGVLAMYRANNSPDAMAKAYKSDFGAAFVEPSPQGFGRNYLGYWETRNLRMVANMRDVLGQHPGMRMLTIVGASHKGYYEAYLNMMHDVRVVSTDIVLK